ncbi:MAG: universal stress protein [Amnibacterium sp.]
MTSATPVPSPATSPDPGAERPRRLVVGVDGSPESVAALRRAAGMAAAMGGTVRAVTCWSYPVLVAAEEPIPFDLLEGGAREAQEEALTAAFGSERPAFLTTAIVQGGAARVLLDESRDADVLVVGSRGHGGFAGLLLGSVSTACAEHAGCDVLVVRDKQAAASERR